jgi:taurine dioxygenase
LSWRTFEPFGAEIEHDFREPLTAEERAAFRNLLFERRLLVMRGQTLSVAQQQDVAAYIGPVLRDGRGLEYISHDDGILNETRLAYHSDLAFAPEPFTALSLHAVDVVEGRTSTLFVDGVRACATLPERLKARIEGRDAVFIRPARPDTRQIDCVAPSPLLQRAREVVWTHPVTGEAVLYVNESHVAAIEGLPAAESRALLEALFDHIYDASNTVEHTWRNGDLLLWDNLALQHGRPDVTGIRPRRLQRASVAERSMVEQIPEFFATRSVPEP